MSEIFISPLLVKPLEVTGTLCHEMAHAAAGVKEAHGPRFVEVCRSVGITKGKPRNLEPGERLNEKLLGYVEKLGPYPHDAMKLVLTKREVKVTTLPIECPKCGCRATMGVKWLKEAGLPTCGCGVPMVIRGVRLREEGSD